MKKLLEGKVAIVTGAGRGLGRAHAFALSRQGAKVVVNDLGAALNGTSTGETPASQVVDELKKEGGAAVASYDSVASPAGAEAIIKAALDNFGRLDILVNNAGIVRDRTILNMSDEEWDDVIKVHLYGTFYCTRNAIRFMREQGFGRIINTSSIAGLGNSGQGNYSAAKEGIIGLTRTVAKEVSGYGITCNAIRPRAATRMTLSQELYEARKRRYGEECAQAWRKHGEARQAEAVSPLVVYLSSDFAENVNGCVFEIFSNFVALYQDPPVLSRTIIKKGGTWSADELVEVMPQTLTKGLISQLTPGTELKLSQQAQGWEWSERQLKESSPFIP